MLKLISLPLFVALAAMAMPFQTAPTAKPGKACVSCKGACCKAGNCSSNNGCCKNGACTSSVGCCSAKKAIGKKSTAFKSTGMKAGRDCCAKPAKKVAKRNGA